MPNIILTKRRVSGSADAPSSLGSGEMAHNEVSDTLFIGVGNNGSDVATSIKAVGGTGAFAAAAQGVPVGGATGQVLAKINATNFNAEWVTPTVGTVTNVTGAAPITSSGGATPAISIIPATGSVPGSMSAADKTKLDGVATGATANSTNATLLARSNHTGTQAVSTITGLATVATSGSATDLTVGTLPAARFNDTAHGARAGGTLHANAVAAGTAGFMTGADKTKLDAISGTNTGDQTSIAGITGTKVQFNTAVTDGNILYAGDVTTNATHTGDVTGATALTIANDTVTNAKAANMATATIKGRTTAGAGDPEDLTATQVRTLLNVANGATANSTNATLLARSNHTGTQLASTISDFAAAVAASGGVTISATAPSNPSNGNQWWDAEIGQMFIYYDDGTSQQWVESSANAQALSYASATNTYTLGGNLTVNGDVNSTSDISLKTNIKTLESATEKLIQMRGVEFDWISSEKRSIGFIAQEVEEIFPELVNITENGIKTVQYQSIIAVLVESIKQLNGRIEELEKK